MNDSVVERELSEKGLAIQRFFTQEGKSPFDSAEYVLRNSVIRNPNGSLVFEMKNVEVPKSWSQVATDILAQKYFRKAGVPQIDENGNAKKDEKGNPVLGPETSARQTVSRLAGCWREWGEKYGYFKSAKDAQAFEDELSFMLLHQMAAPNSPQWFNTGLNLKYGINGPAQGHYFVDPETQELRESSDAYSRAQVHACFIQSVRDDLVNENGIFDLMTREARLFKYGSGTGTNFSTIRGKGEPLSGGGVSSGLMSFLKVIDRAAGAIKSGGTTRRAAKMVCLDIDHPEIEEFIDWKVLEEQKVAGMVAGSRACNKYLNEIIAISDAEKTTDLSKSVLLKNKVREAILSGVPVNYVLRAIQLAKQGEKSIYFPVFDTHYESDAYNTVSGQNSNNSVRISDEFIEAVKEDKEWGLLRRTDRKPMKTVNARGLWNKIARAAWSCADPGIHYDTIMNEWHTCPADGRINATNPCVTGDTLVLTKIGWKRIDRILGNETEIATNLDGLTEGITAGSFFTGKKPVYRLETESGYEVKLTADHKVFTKNRGFVPAAELTKDDFACLPAEQVAEIIETENKEFFQLIGVYLGDGCGSKGKVQITMNKELEVPVLERLAAYCTENFSRITHKNSPSTILETKTSAKLNIASKEALEKIGKYVDLSQKSHEKIISEEIFGLSLGEQKYVLQGLFTADGTVADYGEKSQYISLDSSSLELIKGTQIMLLGFGIKSKIYKNRRAGKTAALLPDGKGGMKEYEVKETHSLRISRSGRIAFEKLIGFMPESHKNRQLNEMNLKTGVYKDSPYDRVKSLEYIGIEKVFDLSEPLTNSFIANGISVHNCSEYVFLDDTACNLASINLIKFYDGQTGEFNVEAFRHAVRLWTAVLEISVLMAQYPSREIALKSHEFRTLGLGYANLGTLLMVSGIPYDSEEARAIAGAITAILCGESYRTSAEMAKDLGPFSKFEKNREHMLKVMRNHRRAAYNAAEKEYEKLSVSPQGIKPQYCQPYLLEAAKTCWDEALLMGEKHGYRNAQSTPEHSIR